MCRLSRRAPVSFRNQIGEADFIEGEPLHFGIILAHAYGRSACRTERSVLHRQPSSQREALDWLAYLQRFGIFVDLGLMQVSTAEAQRRGLPAAFATATADFKTFRLAELQTSPIRGGFDTAHLREIHHHLFQDLYDWAGELRGVDAAAVPASRLEKSLDSLFDRLARKNHLMRRGLVI